MNQYFSVGPLHESATSPVTRLQRGYNSASVRFIRETQEFHGTDMTSKLIGAFAEVLGKNWSTQLIHDMVVGDKEIDEHGEADLFVTADEMPNKIAMIKAIRQATSLGLKESMDAVHELSNASFGFGDMGYRLEHDRPWLKLRYTSGLSIQKCVDELEHVGFKVRHVVK